MYEINPTNYGHLLLNMVAFGSDNMKVLLQGLRTMIWAKEHHHLTECIPKPYIPMALYSTEPSFIWNIPAEPRHNHEYCHKSRDLLVYLVCLLQFLKHDRVEFRIQQGPIQLIAMLANLIKWAANEVLPSGI